MNAENYCSLEVSKKLVAHGIVLETEARWLNVSEHDKSKDWKLDTMGRYPAASLAELWRELPADIYRDRIRYRFCWWKVGDDAGCTYVSQPGRFLLEPINNTNPCDALAELLIWVRKEVKDE